MRPWNCAPRWPIIGFRQTALTYSSSSHNLHLSFALQKQGPFSRREMWPSTRIHPLKMPPLLLMNYLSQMIYYINKEPLLCRNRCLWPAFLWIHISEASAISSREYVLSSSNLSSSFTHKHFIQDRKIFASANACSLIHRIF
jgi:hypothetical protein